MTPLEIRMNALVVLTNCPLNPEDRLAVLDEARRVAVDYLEDIRLPGDEGNISASNVES